MDIIVAICSICASLLSIVSVIVGIRNSSRIKKLEDKSISVEKAAITGHDNSQVIGRNNSVNAQ